MFQLRKPLVPCCSTIKRRFRVPARKHHAHQRETQRQLVADQLRRGAQRAQQRILVVRRPAGQRNAVDADGGDAQNHQQADVHVGDLEEVRAAENGKRLAEGNNADRDQRAAQREDGSEQIERPVDAGGNDVLFEEGFRAIHQRLQEAEGPHAARSPAVLDAPHELALQQHGVGDAQQHHHRHHGYLEHAPQNEPQNRHWSSASSLLQQTYFVRIFTNCAA